MVVGVANESEIDRPRRQGYGAGRADHARHVPDALLSAGFLDVVDELTGNVDGIDFPLRTYFGRKQAGKKSGPRSNVAHRHARLELTRGDDLFALRVDLSALAFERADELLHIGVLEGLIDARTDTFLLSRRESNRAPEHCQC